MEECTVHSLICDVAVLAAAEWFPLDGLPPRSEVAHHGWALSVLKKMVGTAAN